MATNPVLDRIKASGLVTDGAGASYPLSSHTDYAQCEYLQGIVGAIDATTTLEVGLGYGISAMHICAALSGKPGARHHVVDPMQDLWKGIGLKNLSDCGYDPLVAFHGRHSHDVLPELLRSGLRIDFAYVDTTKLFDVVLVDACYIGKMLRVGGVMAFDDCTFPAIRRVARWLAVQPWLEVHSTFHRTPASLARRTAAAFCGLIPGKERLFAPELVVGDGELGVDAHCVAFRKVAEDARAWDWHADF